MRPTARNDIDDPMAKKSSTERLDPNRPMLRRDNVEPRFAKS